MRAETCFRALNGKTYEDEAECLLHDFRFLQQKLTAKITYLPLHGSIEFVQGVLEDARRIMIDVLRVKCEYDAAHAAAAAREQDAQDADRQRHAEMVAEREAEAKRRPYVRIIGRPQPLTIQDVTTIRGVTHYLFHEYPMMWISTDKVTGYPFGEHPAEKKPSEDIEPRREEQTENKKKKGV
mgnify:CR=1 FL=1